MIGPGYLRAMGVSLEPDELLARRAEQRVAFLAGRASAQSVLLSVGQPSLLGSNLRPSARWSRYSLGANEARIDARRQRKSPHGRQRPRWR